MVLLKILHKIRIIILWCKILTLVQECWQNLAKIFINNCRVIWIKMHFKSNCYYNITIHNLVVPLKTYKVKWKLLRLQINWLNNKAKNLLLKVQLIWVALSILVQVKLLPMLLVRCKITEYLVIISIWTSSRNNSNNRNKCSSR